MPSDRPAQRLRDIIANIDDIDSFVRDIRSPDDLVADRRTYKAVMHCLLIIGEAAAKLGDLAYELCPDIPWRSIRNMANIIRHEYDEVDGSTVLRTIHDNLPPLREACVQALGRLTR